MKLPFFLKQTFFRSSAIFVVKFIGLVGRVSLTRWVGAEGIGLYQAAYSFYGLMLILVSGGLPTAIALSAAKDPIRGWRVFKLISLFTLLLGGIVSFLTFRHADWIAAFLGYPKLGFSIRCLSPALFAVPLLSLLRGYLQGLERFTVIAVSEVVEQLVRVAAIMLLVPLFMAGGVAKAVGGSMVGTFAGALLAFLLLTVFSVRHNKPVPTTAEHPSHSALSFVLKTSVAITLTRLLNPISDLIDALLIPKRLQAAGYSALEATEIYGIVIGMAVILVYMPTIFTAALSHTLTMKIAVDWQERRFGAFNRRLRASFKIGWIWGLFSGMLLYVYAPELSLYIFGSAEASRPIQYLSVLPLIVGIREVSTSILWAKNQKTIPMIGLICGISVNTLLIYALAAIPGFGLIGISIGIVCMELAAVGWNLYALHLFRPGMVRYRPLIADIAVFTTIALASAGFSKLIGNAVSLEPISFLSGLLFFCGSAGMYAKIRCSNVFELD